MWLRQSEIIQDEFKVCLKSSCTTTLIAALTGNQYGGPSYFTPLNPDGFGILFLDTG